jgi:hypothetical protein
MHSTFCWHGLKTWLFLLYRNTTKREKAIERILLLLNEKPFKPEMSDNPRNE